MTDSDAKGVKISKPKLQELLKQNSKELLLNPQFNRRIRVLLSPLRYYKYLPKWFWLRVPVIGAFRVPLPKNKQIFYHSLGEYTGRVLYWRGIQGFELGFTSLFFSLAASARVFVDIGAHVGLYTLFAKAVNPSLCAIAFEPIPHVCFQLKQNIMLNHFASTVTIEQMVVAKNSSDTLPFFVSDDASTSSLYRGFVNRYVESKQITVSACTLDDYMRRNNQAIIDLMKIDVEGAEVDVLEGSKEVLLQHRPIIFCEILPKHKDAFSKIQSMLNAAEYNCAIVTSDGLLSLKALSPHPDYHNYLLWPDEKRNLLLSSFLNEPVHTA